MIVHVINYSNKLIGFKQGNFAVVKQQSIEHCPAIGSIWPQTIAGGIALSDSGKLRHCSSNFTVGAHWAQIVQLKVSDLLVKLINNKHRTGLCLISVDHTVYNSNYSRHPTTISLFQLENLWEIME